MRILAEVEAAYDAARQEAETVVGEAYLDIYGLR